MNKTCHFQPWSETPSIRISTTEPCTGGVPCDVDWDHLLNHHLQKDPSPRSQIGSAMSAKQWQGQKCGGIYHINPVDFWGAVHKKGGGVDVAMQRIPVQNGKWMKILCIDWIHLLVGGFNSIENRKSQIGSSSPRFGMKIEKCLMLPPTSLTGSKPLASLWIFGTTLVQA